MTAPPIGRYWQRVESTAPWVADLATCRRSDVTKHFDDANLFRARAIQPIYDALCSRIGTRFLPLVTESPLGDPPRLPIRCADGVITDASISSIEFAAWAATLVPLLEQGTAGKVVVEIGGGYGGLARAVLMATSVVDAWHIVDLPLASTVARWFLRESSHRPGEERCRRVSFHPPSGIERIPAADLIIQTRGFMEMDPPEIAYYFAQMKRLAIPDLTYLWTINRREKVTAFSSWPFDQDWHCLSLKPWGRHMLELLAIRSTSPALPVQKALASLPRSD